MSWPDDYNTSQYESVTIQATQVPGSVTNIDVFVKLSDLSADVQAILRSDGGDARWTLSDGTTQIARATLLDSSGDAYGWRVSVPTISSSVDTVIRLYANGTDTEPAFGSTYGRNAAIGASAHWPDGAGTDYSGAGNDTTQNGGLTVGGATGQVGEATDYDGIGDSASIPAGTIDDSDTAISVGMWLKADDELAQYRPFSYNNNGVYISLRLNSSAAGDVLALVFDGASSTVTETGVTTTDWTHVFLTASESGNLELFINGSSAGTDAVGTFQAVADLGSRLGAARDASGQFFPGLIDSPAIYSTALSADEIAVRYNNEVSPSTFYSTEWVSGGETNARGQRLSGGPLRNGRLLGGVLSRGLSLN